VDVKKILIVDDEEDVTWALKTELERSGMSVTAFHDPQNALDDVKIHHYDLIITDITMPNMNGFELYREIRKHDESSLICFLSAYEIREKEFAQLFPDMKALTFLRKPISVADLVVDIDELTRCAQGRTD
jgi:DNA-binding response OmpR family regulator